MKITYLRGYDDPVDLDIVEIKQMKDKWFRLVDKVDNVYYAEEFFASIEGEMFALLSENA